MSVDVNGDKFGWEKEVSYNDCQFYGFWKEVEREVQGWCLRRRDMAMVMKWRIEC